MFKLKKKSNRSNLDENQLQLLVKWLDELNHNDLIRLTDDNDLVVMIGGKNDLNQQIFIYSKHIDFYMRNEMNDEYPIVIQMSDIAKILIEFNYIKQISGQWVFP